MGSSLSISSFPQAIIHIDADSFFASCEQSVNPALKGKPVVTGQERGIVSAASYEAKALGITRAMPLHEVQKKFPQVVVMPSDYELYSLFSERMFSIIRRYTNAVEEYSIDECFAEISGLRRPLKMSYEQIARRIKKDLDWELNMTFSVGLAPTKVLAKIASKWDKPSGCVVIPGKSIHTFLAKVPVQDIWGVGGQTTKYLQQFGIRTALQLAEKDELWVREKLTKPHYEIWHELRGRSILKVELEGKQSYKSISKTKTFTPPSNNRAYILSQLSKNAENACIKARRYNLEASRVYFFLKTQDFRYRGFELTLSAPTALPNAVIGLIDKHLDSVRDPNKLYRSTGVVLAGLREQGAGQPDLFGEMIHAEKLSQVYGVIDQLDKKYGKHTVFLGSSFQTIKGKQFGGDRATPTGRKQTLFRGEGIRKRVGLPLLGDVV